MRHYLYFTVLLALFLSSVFDSRLHDQNMRVNELEKYQLKTNEVMIKLMQEQENE